MKYVDQKDCRVSICGDFQDHTAQGPEQHGLTSQLSLLWAGGCARDLLRFLPA